MCVPQQIDSHIDPWSIGFLQNCSCSLMGTVTIKTWRPRFVYGSGLVEFGDSSSHIGGDVVRFLEANHGLGSFFMVAHPSTATIRQTKRDARCEDDAGRLTPWMVLITAAICHLPSSVAICRHLLPSAVVCHHLPPSTAVFDSDGVFRSLIHPTKACYFEIVSPLWVLGAIRKGGPPQHFGKTPAVGGGALVLEFSKLSGSSI